MIIISIITPITNYITFSLYVVGFKWHCIYSLLILLSISVVKSFTDFFARILGVLWRKHLTNHIHHLYFDQMKFYKLISVGKSDLYFNMLIIFFISETLFYCWQMHMGNYSRAVHLLFLRLALNSITYRLLFSANPIYLLFLKLLASMFN